MSDNPQGVFTILEAARFLRISRAMLFKLIAAKKLQTFHIGRRTLLTAGELLRFIQVQQS